MIDEGYSEEELEEGVPEEGSEEMGEGEGEGSPDEESNHQDAAYEQPKGRSTDSPKSRQYGSTDEDGQEGGGAAGRPEVRGPLGQFGATKGPRGTKALKQGRTCVFHAGVTQRNLEQIVTSLDPAMQNATKI